MSDLFGRLNDHDFSTREILRSLNFFTNCRELQNYKFHLFGFPLSSLEMFSIWSRKTIIEPNASDIQWSWVLEALISFATSWTFLMKKLFSYLWLNLNRGNNHCRLSLGIEFFVLKGAVKTPLWLMELNFIKNNFSKRSKSFHSSRGKFLALIKVRSLLGRARKS